MNRKEEISKGCGKKRTRWNSDYQEVVVCGEKKDDYIWYCPTCQARLDERIRAEQDFLKIINNELLFLELLSQELDEGDCIDEANMVNEQIRALKEILKSTIKQEKT
jgi:hypothetical protein